MWHLIKILSEVENKRQNQIKLYNLEAWALSN